MSQEKYSESYSDICDTFAELTDAQLEFMNAFNPAHFYCRIRELGFPKEVAKVYARFYQLYAYDPIVNEVKRRYICEQKNDL